MVKSGKESTNFTVKSGKAFTNFHFPQESGKELTFFTFKSGKLVTTFTLKSGKLSTILILPCNLFPLKVQSFPTFPLALTKLGIIKNNSPILMNQDFPLQMKPHGS